MDLCWLCGISCLQIDRYAEYPLYELIAALIAKAFPLALIAKAFPLTLIHFYFLCCANHRT
jgi:hypothetical protein